MNNKEYALTIACDNQPGIVAQVSTLLFDHGGDIFDAQQFDDAESKRFFMRILFTLATDFDQFQSRFESLANGLNMDWAMRDRTIRRRIMILVSKFDHCLADLLYRFRIGEFDMDVAAIVSNHPRDTFDGLDFADIPFHYLSVSKQTKPDQEARLLDLIETSGTDLVVLARYMQILSDDLSMQLFGRCINIHHSFLPSFKGAKPYHQAYERGVKIIGATAHFVTPALDEGPIIAQDVERISHADTPKDLVRKGRDIERRVLAQAVRLYLEDRILLNRKKTIVLEN